MIPIFLALMILSTPVAAVDDPSEQTAQMVPSGPMPGPNPLRKQLRYLERQNDDLKRMVQALEPYREMTAYFQQRLSEAEQSLNDVKQGAASLMQANQAQVAHDRQQIEKLKQDLQLSASNYAAQIKQAAVQKQALAQEKFEAQKILAAKNQVELELQEHKNRSAQSERLMQFLRDRAETLQKENQSLQAALDNSDKQLRSMRQEQTAQLQAGDEDLKKQIRNLKRDLEDNRSALDTLQRQKESLNIENGSFKDQLKAQTKRLETNEQRSMTEYQAMEARYQALIEEKGAAIEKWREAHAQLQTQLETAASINNQLRQQVANLQAECEKK